MLIPLSSLPLNTMLRYLTNLAFTYILLTYVSTFVFNTFSCPFVNAQQFQPTPVTTSCSVFVEGRGLYVFGGRTGPPRNQRHISQAFMLDLSVSWSTSNPAFKQLPDFLVDGESCTLSKNGDELFVFSVNTGYIYNLESGSLTTMEARPFQFSGKTTSLTDQESGLVYIFDKMMNRTDTRGLITVNLTARTFETVQPSKIPMSTVAGIQSGVWSAPLRSMLVASDQEEDMQIFTPSKMMEPSGGWYNFSTNSLTQYPLPVNKLHGCLVPAYNGSKVVLVGSMLNLVNPDSAVYFLDVASQVWTKGPTIPLVLFSACAVTGDQLILWGGQVMETDPVKYSGIFVLDMNTMKWTNSYISPSDQSKTQSTTSQEQETSANLAQLLIITTVVPSVAFLTAIIVYFGTRRWWITQSDASNSIETLQDSFNSMETLQDSSNSMKALQDYSSHRNTHMRGRFSLLDLRSYEIRLEQPHAIVKDIVERRNVQEGAVEIELISQNPHTTLEDEGISGQTIAVADELLARDDIVELGPIDDRILTTNTDDRTEWKPVKSYSGKVEPQS
ncbi:MAG: hypothetical protein J3Q66DRAFT_422684 [Benniella sp.]|nr:MAG: hypothetical protein J3Q66DRAFT_422684 [Benniella sp.]